MRLFRIGRGQRDPLDRHLIVDGVAEVRWREFGPSPWLEVAAHRLRRLALQFLEVRALGRLGLGLDKRFGVRLRQWALGRWLLRVGICGRIGARRPWMIGPLHTVLASPGCYIRSACRPLKRGGPAGATR